MDKSKRQRIRYLRTADGVQLAWAEAGGWAGTDQGRELADASRVRMGEPGLAALDPILH